MKNILYLADWRRDGVSPSWSFPSQKMEEELEGIPFHHGHCSVSISNYGRGILSMSRLFEPIKISAAVLIAGLFSPYSAKIRQDKSAVRRLGYGAVFSHSLPALAFFRASLRHIIAALILAGSNERTETGQRLLRSNSSSSPAFPSPWGGAYPAGRTACHNRHL